MINKCIYIEIKMTTKNIYCELWKSAQIMQSDIKYKKEHITPCRGLGTSDTLGSKMKNNR